MKTELVTLMVVVALLVCGCSGLARDERAAATAAIEALELIDDIARPGMAKEDYALAVAVASGRVNDLAGVLPEGELMDSIQSSMRAFADVQVAGDAGGIGILLAQDRPTSRLMREYDIPLSPRCEATSRFEEGAFTTTEIAMTTILEVARERLATARELLRA